ncbi:MAG TPA: hypothetical protein VGH99_17065 [Pseudonocardia sp.]
MVRPGEPPAKIKLGVSGCPRNCAEATVKDLGIVPVGDDRCDIHISGAAGAWVPVRTSVHVRRWRARPDRESAG